MKKRITIRILTSSIISLMFSIFLYFVITYSNISSWYLALLATLAIFLYLSLFIFALLSILSYPLKELIEKVKSKLWKSLFRSILVYILFPVLLIQIVSIITIYIFDTQILTLINPNYTVQVLKEIAKDVETQKLDVDEEFLKRRYPEVYKNIVGEIKREVKKTIKVEGVGYFVVGDKKVEYKGISLTELENLKVILRKISLLSVLHEQLLNAVVLTILFSNIPLIILSLFFAFMLSLNISEPIGELINATEHIARGDFAYSIDFSKAGNLEDYIMLFKAFNKMGRDLAEYKERLVKLERVESWKEVAQKLAHEVKNPLTPMHLAAQEILYTYYSSPQTLPEVLEKNINIILSEIHRIDKIISAFSYFAKLPIPQIKNYALEEIVYETVELMQKQFPEASIEILGRWKGSVKADKDLIKQVLINLIKNAIEACKEKGTLQIKVGFFKYTSGKVVVFVRDRGSGIPKNLLPNVFKPYFSTKGKERGLGLPIVEKIILDHNEQIWVKTSENGTVFFFTLSIAEN